MFCKPSGSGIGFRTRRGLQPLNFATMISVSTETTATHDKQVPANWVLYDASCPRCTAWALRFRSTLKHRGFLVAPLQSLWVPSALGIGPRELLREMRVFTARGELYSGADALVYLARCIPWASPLWAAAQLPGMRRLLRAAYRWLAARRHCTTATCTLAGGGR